MRAKFRPTCGPLGRHRAGFARHARWRGAELVVLTPTALERLMARQLARALTAFPEPHFSRPLRRALRQAAELADASGFPLLVFPELFAELAIAALLESEYRRLGQI